MTDASTDDPYAKYRIKPAAPAAAASPDPYAKYRTGPAPPQVGQAEDIGRGALAGVVRGGQGLAELPTSGLSLVNRGLGWGAEKLGASNLAGRFRQQAEDLQRMTAQAHQVLDQATGGVGKYEPQTTGGRVAEKLGEFAPGMAIPGVGLGSRLAEAGVGRIAGQVAGRALENVAAPAAGSALGERVGEEVGHPALGSFIGAAGAGGLASLRGPSMAVDPALATAAERQNVRLPIGVASDSRGVPTMTKFLENVPGAGEPLQAAGQRAVEDIRGAKGGAEQAQGATTRELAGAKAKEGLTDWMTGRSKKEVSDAYDAADKLMDPNATSDLSNTRAAVADILARRQASAAPDKVGRAVGEVQEGMQRAGGMTYEGIKDMRTRMGQKVDTSLLPPEWDKAEVKRLYEALSSDLDNAAKTAGGPQGAAAYQKASALAKTTADRRAALAKLVGKKGEYSAEAVFDNVAKLASDGGRANMALLRQAHDTIGRPDWEELGGTIGSRLGYDAPSDGFSLQKFTTAYNKMSEEGKTALFGQKGQGLRQTYDDLATIGQRQNMLRQYTNPSGTGRQAIGAAEVVKGVRDPLGTLATIGGGRLVAHILATPTTAKPFIRFMRAAQEDAGPARTLKTGVALSNAARNFAQTANSQLGTKLTAEQLTGGQGGAGSGGSEPFRVEVPYHIRQNP